ncbi:MAG TPA: BON domain-containing protein [Pyrinomonadaceae bacterium]
MKSFWVISLLVIALVVIQAPVIRGQQLRSTAQAKQSISRLETSTDRFSKRLDAALDRSRLDDSRLEDQVNALVDEFEFATDRLKERVDDDMAIESDVREVLRRGLRLDMFMKTHRLTPAAQGDWRRVKNNLDQLARSFGVGWVWAPVQDTALNRASTRQVLQRLEEAANDFRDSFDGSLDRSRIDGSQYEDFMNRIVKTFERSIEKLEDQADRSESLNSADVRTALTNAAAIDDFVSRHSLSMRTRSDWSRVKANLDDLAFLNQVAWDWRSRQAAPITMINQPPAQGERISLGPMPNRATSAIAREIRHELLSDLPYYGVFDWIEFEVLPDQTVVLRGAVTAPADKRSKAEDVVEDISGVRRVINEIRVLSVSPNDQRLRRALYREIYGFDSPLFRYGVGSRQAIHIIVDGGRATLKGIVESERDKNLAYLRAQSVPGLFEVKNELVVDGQFRMPA